ncbi:MAG TPA: ornithine cyclodeaminase family protein [Verrucomicrobiae bacterium]|nr:ornithine cyclodeaminase family protein [Verrucomicrobiae bacterium]
MKTSVISLRRIRDVVTNLSVETLTTAMEQGFIAYSEGRAVVPPVGLLQFEVPPGDTHIKYGFIRGDAVYLIKVATNFYDNPKQGLPSSNGVMLVFDQKTGELLTILLDEGYLTNVRTAVAGAVVAKYLAPSKVNAIGIVGTGTQARMQLQYLKEVVDCRRVYIYGRSKETLQAYVKDMQPYGFEITTTMNLEDITDHCNYIVTTTPSARQLIQADRVKPGMHITAMGADAAGKQELDPIILQRADLVVVDSKAQCIDHGEAYYAIQQEIITPDKLMELGSFIKYGQHRKHDSQITIADLTGVAVQDIQIAKLVYEGGVRNG